MSVNIRQICNTNSILRVMLVHFREWKYIEWNSPGSDTYLCIKQWCNTEKDLKVVGDANDGIQQTDNGILYDVKTDSFVHLDDMNPVSFDLSLYLPNGLDKILGFQLPDETEYVTEDVFPGTLLERLQTCGGIGPRITVPANMIKY